MTTEQPLALTLAQIYEGPYGSFTDHKVAAELRRQHAEIAKLRGALARCREMVGHPDNIAFIDAALAQGEKT